MHEHTLLGCRPVPLASYLKALAVLRLVGEQKDPAARGYWREDAFVLRTTLDHEALHQFLLYEYAPTPIVAPWNGGSGFYPKDNRQAIQQISGSKAARLDSYRAAIESSSAILVELGVGEKLSSEQKRRLLEACRGRLSDLVLPWLDAVFLLTGDAAKYPPLLGTGGNDGRLDFTNNFMQRLLDVIDPVTGEPTRDAGELLEAALHDRPTDHLTGGAIGQFFPSAAGGANASSGFAGDSRSNSWEFVFMLEGAATFAVAAVQRMGEATRGALSYPFTVRAAGAGYASAADADETASRGEIWLPLWERPATSAEVRALLGEGRARVSGRTARNGVDFARAIATLGVDRGISELQRYGIQVRNGLAYLATPLGRFQVHREPGAHRLDEIDEWLGTFRRRATEDRAPAAARRALRLLDDAILGLCRRGGPARAQAVLVALGQCERVMARSLQWAMNDQRPLSPVPALSPEWLGESDDGSTELRLAAALGSVFARQGRHQLPLRRHLEPVSTQFVKGGLRVDWDRSAGRDVVWTDGDIVPALNAVLARRLISFQQWGAETYLDEARVGVHLADISAFIERRTDDVRLSRLLWATILIDWTRCDHSPLREAPHGAALPPAFFGLLKLCFQGARAPGDPVPLVPRIQRLAAAGEGAPASLAAVRRLVASGLKPAVHVVHQRARPSQRTAAAILFPLAHDQLVMIRRTVLRPANQPGATPS